MVPQYKLEQFIAYISGSPPWAGFIFEEERNLNIPFYKRSVFGAYADEICGQMEDHNEKLSQSNREYSLNPLYDASFLKMLKKEYFTYFPIISHAVFSACNVDVSDDTTNAIGITY